MPIDIAGVIGRDWRNDSECVHDLEKFARFPAGVQEVIIESPRHLRDLAELSPAEFAVALVALAVFTLPWGLAIIPLGLWLWRKG